MHSTHALSPDSASAARAWSDAVYDAVDAIIGHRPEPSDRLEADLALDSIDLVRIAAALPSELLGALRRFDFDGLVGLTMADLAAAVPGQAHFELDRNS